MVAKSKTKAASADVQEMLDTGNRIVNSTDRASLDQLLATIDSLPKDSPEFQRLRRRVYGKAITKEAKPELVSVFREAVKLHGWSQVRLAFNQVKKERMP